MPEFEPHTRNEALLNAIRENTGGGTGSVDFEPRTRNEYLLNEIRKNTEGGGGSGLPDVTDADNGKVLKVADGTWGVGNNIHWLEGGSTYLPYTQTFLIAVTDAIPVMLQNNYMSYTVAVQFSSTVAANVVAMAEEIIEALTDGETPIYRSTGITGVYDMICPLKYASFDPAAPTSNFDLLVSGYVYYPVQGAGYFAANAEVSISHRKNAGAMFIKFDHLVDGAHS